MTVGGEVVLVEEDLARAIEDMVERKYAWKDEEPGKALKKLVGYMVGEERVPEGVEVNPIVIPPHETVRIQRMLERGPSRILKPGTYTGEEGRARGGRAWRRGAKGRRMMAAPGRRTRHATATGHASP